MRATTHARSRVSGVLLLAFASCMLLAQTAAGKAPVKVNKVGKPPAAAIEAGSSFQLKAKIKNRSKKATRPKVTVRLHSARRARGRIVETRRFSRLAPGRARRFTVAVDVPESLAAGRYYLTLCAKARGKRSCLLAGRRATVVVPPAPGGQGNPPAPPGNPGNPGNPGGSPDKFSVLVFTETGVEDADSEYHASTPAGIDAIRQLGKDAKFKVDVTDDSDGFFTPDTLDDYRVVVFLNTSGNVLTAAQQAAFEDYYKAGGGFLAIHGAIATEPGWEFLTDLLGTRAEGEESLVEQATIKVADRVHDASKALPLRWQHEDAYYNFADNVRGFSHVLATVDESTYEGGEMGLDHPVSWCKDFQGGRSFYTAAGHTAAAFAQANLRTHLAGAIQWAAGESDPVYSDCGATVLANYQQTKISAPPNLDEPIGFDQLPDGRIVQTARRGQVRLHDPSDQSSRVIANIPVYTHSEDGLYGPAVDRNFEENHWVYLFYSPLQMEGNDPSGKPYPATTPAGNAPTTPQPSLDAWDEWRGYFQLSRFKFVDGENPSLDLASEQKIMKVHVDRGACCHVAGDIDFDEDNNLWLVTGDDTPSGAGNAGGFGPMNDLKTDEWQTVRANGATGGTFTLTWDGQTTAPIPYNATGAAVEAALEGLSNLDPADIVVHCGAFPCSAQQTVNLGNVTMNMVFTGQYDETDVPQVTADATGLTGTTPAVAIATSQQAGMFHPPWFDGRRSSLNTNDLRGKILRIDVNEDGSYEPVEGNLFDGTEEGGGKTRPEIYAMGFRNPFRIQVDSDDIAYITDYSPDERTSPAPLRGPMGTGRVEIVREPSNYGWPQCMSPTLPMYQWDYNTSLTLGAPWSCGDEDSGPPNASRHNTGLAVTPPLTAPDIWYTFTNTWGTPCLDGYDDAPAEVCPNLFPELGEGGVGPHGAAKYEYDPDNPSTTKFPPYYDDAVFLGEFTRDYLKEVRLDEDGKVFKINNLLDCGALGTVGPPFECDNPMDLQFGADGAFYLLTYGDGFFAANPDAGMYKWEYVKGARAPQAVLAASVTNGLAPLEVEFSSDGTRDPDPSDSITYAWDLDGDGQTDDSTDPNPEWTYTRNGVYVVKLTVTDSSGKTDTKTTTITVGNTAATLQITTPVDGDFFEWGDDIPFTITGSDPEDGAIDCSKVAVTFVLIHDQHGHGEDSKSGCSGTLETDPDDASHGGYIAGGINVTYTDSGANGQPPLTTQVQHVIQIRRQQAEFMQEQSGTAPANLPGAEPDLGGGLARSGLDDGDWLAINNRVNLANMDKQISFRFAAAGAAGTDRANVEIHLDSPTGPIATTATLKSTGSNNTYTTQTFPLDFTGSRRVYLVFKPVAGGVTTGFGNLNWVEFSGPGAGV
jgi:PKD repeat protein/type 1 glutamine amidotransferase